MRYATELADLAGNPVLSLVLSVLTELFRRHGAGRDQPLPSTSTAEEMQQVHRRLLDAVLEGDTGLARLRMRRHVDSLVPWWH